MGARLTVVIGRRQRDNIWRFVSLHRRAVIALDDGLRPLNQVGVEFLSPRGLPHDQPQDLERFSLLAIEALRLFLTLGLGRLVDIGCV